MVTRSKKSEQRRQEAKRQRLEQRGTWWRTLLAGVHPLVVVIWLGFFVGTLLVLVSGSESLPYAQNQTLSQDVYARVPFEIVDQARIRQERQIAEASAPAVYMANPAPLENVRGKLTELLTVSKSAGQLDEIRKLARDRALELDDAAIQALRSFASTERSQEFDTLVAELVDRLGGEYIVAPPRNPIRKQPPRTSILLRDGLRTEITTATLQFNTNRQYVEKRANELAEAVFPPALEPAVAAIITTSLMPPEDAENVVDYALWRYDPAATQHEIEEALQRVPEFKTPYQPGDLLVEAGTTLSPNELNVLARHHEQFLEAQRTDPELRRQHLQRQFGMGGLILLITFGLAAYTMTYQDRVFRNPSRAFALFGLFFLFVLLSRLNEQVQFPWDAPVEFSVACITTAAILLTIAYNQRFAFGACGALAVLIVMASRAEIWLFLTLMAAAGVAVFSLNEVRTRGKIIAVGALAGLAAFLTSAFGHLYDGQEWRFVLAHALAGGVAAVAAGFVVQGILHYFERMFGIATSLTLLEWCDANQPLLRKLAQEAPGTYSHALILSQMADEAATAIGANGLLTRVGALYHDIGKTQKSQYFVENQEARMNRHDKLSPTMSLLIILGHVKDGLEMARAYGLPRVLHQFITEHHGTTLVKYFHHAASEKAAKDSRIKGRNDQISDSEFRYPGPRPRSKESAILMICDSCEGAARALSEPTSGRIETLVHQIVMERLNDGQFDDCDITLKELHLVERSLVKSLCAIHHGRIKYPSKAAAGQERAAAEEKVEEKEPRQESGTAPGEAAEPNEVPRQAEVARQP